MKPSRWIQNVGNFITNLELIEIMVILAIIAILAAMLVPAFAKAKRREQQLKAQTSQIENPQSFQIGDTVTVKGLDKKGTINYVSDNGFVDVVIAGNNSEPTILKGINAKLVNK